MLQNLQEHFSYKIIRFFVMSMNCTVEALFVAVFSLTGWFQNDVGVSASCLKQLLLLQQLQWDLL